MGSDVVETATFETETWLKFGDETENEISSKTPKPRLETWSSRSRLDASKFMHFAEIKKNVVIIYDLNVFQIPGIFPTYLFLTCIYNKQNIFEL